MPRGSRTPRMHPHFEVIPHAPSVAYPRIARPICGNPACSEGCVPSKCTSGLKLSHILRGLRTLGMRSHFEAAPHAPRVVYPRNALSL